MKYKEQGTEHSSAYGQALRRRCSQKYTCPFGLRLKWRATLSKPLTVVPARGYGLFLVSRHFRLQRSAIIIAGIGSI
jgi:hypothetical protein